MQGQVAGVQISAGSGQPGEASQINIRGISTFSAEGVKPLYVVDGIPMEDIDGINPGDITSIEILKDAASAAMYGSRSANGVILITTKGGQEGAPRIDVKYLHTWGKLSHKLAQATRADRRKFDILRDTYHKDNATGYVDNASNQLINDSLNAAFNVDNDYQDLLFQWAQKDQVDLSVAGGTKKMKYFGSTGYYNERGIVPNTNFQRLTARYQRRLHGQQLADASQPRFAGLLPEERHQRGPADDRDALGAGPISTSTIPTARWPAYSRARRARWHR